MDKITLKNSQEIEIMRQGGHLAATILGKLKEKTRAGVTTRQIDQFAEKEIVRSGARPSFKGFNGYPASTCISINNEIVHGLPSERRVIDGDIVSIDLGVYFKGYHSDTAITFGIGKILPDTERLILITEKSLDNAIGHVKAGIRLGDIQSLIQETIEKEGFSVVRDLTGHGIGRSLQEAPQIPNFGNFGEGIILKEGMTLALEPMVTMGDWHIKILDDGWTIVTADNSLAAHFEHTILVTRNGAEILTQK